MMVWGPCPFILFFLLMNTYRAPSNVASIVLETTDKNRRAMDKAWSVFKDLMVKNGGRPTSNNHNWLWHVDSGVGIDGW